MTKSVLITGASQGSGRATALLFAQKGYNVAIAARQLDRLEAVAAEVRARGQQAIALSTDVSEAEQVEALVNKALAEFGQIDVLVNNAGVCLTGSVEHMTLADWHQLIDVNLWGYIHTIHYVLPQMVQQGSGAIVNVGSFGGKMPLPNMTAYCTSKYAVTGLSATLRLELSGKGIHVAAVHPGVINSSFMERAMFRGEDAQKAGQQRDRMGEMLSQSWVSQPEEIAQAVWQAVDQRQDEIVVGPAAIATEAYRLLPGLTQWALGRAT
ncbi:MAG: SDR family oxidoreductase [Leptolyngbyaceae cyanobacterium SM1_1_3]|nr:SDR family oxidoreductase [Leptolyngbyaceae cyanobacterium SM1_1_3]NJN03567.1 SDR family oxidoreductase [Leptolyngbyaceae cyanobacterium RM1_1_2]NJO11385.1 SDR family oxidoreductase [Leptolyngbyaceae cyanobacterium SL_1_1]